MDPEGGMEERGMGEGVGERPGGREGGTKEGCMNSKTSTAPTCTRK